MCGLNICHLYEHMQFWTLERTICESNPMIFSNNRCQLENSWTIVVILLRPDICTNPTDLEVWVWWTQYSLCMIKNNVMITISWMSHPIPGYTLSRLQHALRIWLRDVVNGNAFTGWGHALLGQHLQHIRMLCAIWNNLNCWYEYK